MKRRSFRREIFFYFIVIFVLFTVAILAFQYQREKRYRITQLENTLDNITEITHLFILRNKLLERDQISRISELEEIIPQPNTRLTLISHEGVILFDSSVDDFRHMSNHLDRPEIRQAIQGIKGANIRLSGTTGEKYYYYAKKYPGYFIRAAVVYNIQIQNFLRAERAFLFFIIAVFLLIGIILYYATGKMSDAITKLKDFSIRAGRDQVIEPETHFPENELGIIGSQIIKIYHDLKKAKDDLLAEKEKLLNHLNALNEGIAFFSSQKNKTLANRHFIQYAQIISGRTVHTVDDILHLEDLEKLRGFLDKNLAGRINVKQDTLPQIEFIITSGEKYFKIQSIIFPDKSFEVVITDITRLEKRRLMKQQLTSNIAHELKTPLASIKGYLETLLNKYPVTPEKQKYFLGRTYLQAERLTDLINDVSLLNNIEDAGELFRFKPINIKSLIDEARENFANRMDQKNIRFLSEVGDQVVLPGNESLLYSVFQNLIENSINYGGDGINIILKVYHQDDRYFYFSYSDNGNGIPEEHLPRIFERFYRVDHGRTREMGGTGLGLAIVKNAIHLHKGEISVRNKPEGGIEFLFSLSRK